MELFNILSLALLLVAPAVEGRAIAMGGEHKKNMTGPMDMNQRAVNSTSDKSVAPGASGLGSSLGGAAGSAGGAAGGAGGALGGAGNPLSAVEQALTGVLGARQGLVPGGIVPSGIVPSGIIPGSNSPSASGVAPTGADPSAPNGADPSGAPAGSTFYCCSSSPGSSPSLASIVANVNCPMIPVLTIVEFYNTCSTDNHRVTCAPSQNGESNNGLLSSQCTVNVPIQIN